MKKDKALTIACPKCQAPAGGHCPKAWYGMHAERRAAVGQVWRKCPHCLKGLLRQARNAENPVPKHRQITYAGERITKWTPDCEGSGLTPVRYPEERS